MLVNKMNYTNFPILKHRRSLNKTVQSWKLKSSWRYFYSFHSLISTETQLVFIISKLEKN